MTDNRFEIVRFHGAEFHYRWLTDAAKAEHDQLFAEVGELIETYREELSTGLREHGVEEFRSFCERCKPYTSRMAELKAGYWFAEKIILTGALNPSDDQ